MALGWVAPRTDGLTRFSWDPKSLAWFKVHEMYRLAPQAPSGRRTPPPRWTSTPARAGRRPQRARRAEHRRSSLAGLTRPRAAPGAGRGVSRYRTRVPVLPAVAARILRTARRDENGCLISLLAPSQKRPNVKVGGTQVKATRVVMAVHLDRPIEANEDVHHAECRAVRCVEPAHLAFYRAYGPCSARSAVR